VSTVTVRVLIEATWHGEDRTQVIEAGSVVLLGPQNLPEVRELLHDIADAWPQDGELP
jgi:hypothetical protein